MRSLWLTCFAVAALGCAASEEEIKADFQQFVSKHQACTEDSDCTIISPGCPLGCATALAKDAAAAGERLAEDLIEDYERGGRSCAYDCSLFCGAVCEAGQCAVAKPPSSTGVCER